MKTINNILEWRVKRVTLFPIMSYFEVICFAEIHPETRQKGRLFSNFYFLINVCEILNLQVH